jgi:ketosteroid isomerase-like protein
MAPRETIATHPNLEVARALWDAVSEGDAEAVQQLLAEDVVWTSVGHNPLSGVRNGPEQVLDYLAEVGESADELCSSLGQVFVNDEGALVTYRVSASRGSKQLVEMQYFLKLGIRAGRVESATMIAADQYRNDEFWS